METRYSAAFLVGLIGALAAIYAQSSAIRTPGESGPLQPHFSKGKLASQTEKPAQRGYPRAKDLVSQFLFNDEGGGADSSYNASAESFEIDFLIATVPDPVSSRLPYFFDTFADSIESAIEAAGYTPDRFALPWLQKSSEDGDTASLYQPKLYESEPGLILFRSPRERKLLLVFLVGETPTTGIQKVAMISALDQLAEFYSWDPKHANLPRMFPKAASQGSIDTFRVMGPSFSGSAISLRSVLDRWLASRNNPSNLRFEIVSGTATAIDSNWLAQAGGGHATFQATVPPDDETVQATACYIQRLGYHKIAILTEGNTAYGQNLTRRFVPEGPNRGQAQKGCGDTQDIPEILTLPFPLHISRLRRASDVERLQQGQSGAGTGGTKPLSVPAPQEDTAEPREVLPAFSNLSVSSAELTLSNLLSTIAREGYSYVGIVATDVRDATFLAREVRDHCPATVLFTINSDLHYAQPKVNDITRGMIIVTPYPLFNLEQLWTYAYRGNQTRLQFPNQAAEGVYNATLALLHEGGKMVDYGKPLPTAGDTQQNEILKPSLWVTAVGNGETLPVSLLKWEDRGNYTYSPGLDAAPVPEAEGFTRPDIGRGIYTEDSVVVFIVISLFISIFSLLIVYQFHSAQKISENNWPSLLLGDTASPAYWSECRLFLLGCCASLLAFYLVVATDFCLPVFAGRESGNSFQTTLTAEVAILISLGTLLLLLGATYAIAAALRAAPNKQRGSAPEVILVVLVGCCLVFILAAILVGSWLATLRKYPASGLFIYLRSFDLSGGLSPLLPLSCVAMGAFLWALCSFRRLRMIDILRAVGTVERAHRWLDFLPLDVPSFKGVQVLENNVKGVLESSSVISLKWYASLIAVALLVGHYFFDTRLVRAIEPRPFYWLFEAAFLIVYWALLMEFLRLVLAWRSLHLLLERLSWHPMRKAYKRYRECFPGLGKMNLTHPPSNFAALECSITQADRLLFKAKTLVIAGDTSADLREIVRQSIAEWEPQVLIAQSQLAHAFKLQWSDSSHGNACLQEDTATRKKRASHTPGDWRQSLQSCCRAQWALTRFLHAQGDTMERYWVSNQAGSARLDWTQKEREFFDLGEEFIAGRVVSFLAIVFPSLQNLAYFVLAGLMLMLLAVTSYPFQPRNEFLFFNWVVILGFVGTVCWIFVQMDRNAVLSFLTDTMPGQVSLDRALVLRMLLYGVVPVLALLGAQFPESLRRILSLFTGGPGGT